MYYINYNSSQSQLVLQWTDNCCDAHQQCADGSHRSEEKCTWPGGRGWVDMFEDNEDSSRANDGEDEAARSGTAVGPVKLWSRFI